MNRDYLIARMNRVDADVLARVDRLKHVNADVLESADTSKECCLQVELVEDIEYILLSAHKQIEDKIAEYSLKTA